MPRILRRTAAIAVLLTTWALLGSDRAPLPVTMGEAVAGPPSYAAPSERAARSGSDKPQHDLSSLRTLTKVILYVKENYVDPKRVKPREMMVAALEYVEKAVPDVLVEGTAESGKIRVNVNGKIREFDISHIDSLWKMSFTLKDVFEFISENMRPMEDTRDVEYAAVNGMLSTLDPHSVLLRPEVFREMKLSTKGEFGGLGFVIQMKEGNLTVVRVLPKTPAYRAGIKKDDVIRKIEEESTVNMDLNEAVSKLRGPVDSKVTITVDRKGWEKPQVMTITRATITIESVQSKLLAGNVGYVRLKNFQGNTTRDLQTALDELGQQAKGDGGLKGVVLDLRGNPGGLLEQAIQVSDQFLSSGTIVSTVGFSDKLREEKKARRDPNDDKYPVAVLVNSGSASASEIVAGALKNLNRAVIIGRQTFGKGSVQVLYDFPDDSALKLTIAKYLTPGDVSIQEVGIVPDILLLPARVTKERVNVFSPRKSVGEADLEGHFGNSDSKAAAKKREEVLARGEKPSFELKYLKEDVKQTDASAKQQLAEEGRLPAKRDLKKGRPLLDIDIDTGGSLEDLDDQLDAEAQDEIKEDFEVLFARDFVLKAPFTERDKMLKQGRTFLDGKRADEEQRIQKAVELLGLDWSPGPRPQSPQLAATLLPQNGHSINAGDTVDLELLVENKGQEPLKRVRAWTESDNPYLDRREFLLGGIPPGERRSWKVPVKLPKDLLSRRDDVTVKLVDDQGALPGTVVGELNFVALPRPAFAFNWQILDRCKECNGDGVAERGEQIELVLDVKNTGAGKALDSFAQIKNAADENIFIEKGRFKLGELEPGETKTARFVLEVKKPYRGNSFGLKLAIIDEPLEEFTSEKLDVPVAPEPLAVEQRHATLRNNAPVDLFASPTEKARTIAKLPKGTALQATAKVGAWWRVDLGEDRFAFVPTSEVKEQRAAKVPPLKDAQLVVARQPPEIELSVDTSKGGIVADGERFTLSGVVTDPRDILDVYILVNDQKVYFKGTPVGDEAATHKVKFSTDFPLKEGNNTVTVVARESEDFASRRTLVIRRRP
ncbi:MAG TPA: MXAN_5808 family serine peptidase, partial [Myxococcaceae bacterium]|nr:MXAN_5808 family serine peptidase [Myxococcaceae bacterium]